MIPRGGDDVDAGFASNAAPPHAQPLGGRAACLGLACYYVPGDGTLAWAGSSFWDSLGDTDDAARLVSVRELLAGARWFDTTLPRIGAPEPLVSHWSRLIDAPLGVMIAVFAPLLVTTAQNWRPASFGLPCCSLHLSLSSRARRSGGPGHWPQPSCYIS